MIWRIFWFNIHSKKQKGKVIRSSLLRSEVCVCVFFSREFVGLENLFIFKQDVLPKLTNSKKSLSLRYAKNLLGGGFKYFLFSPLLGDDFQFDSYFSIGLKPPTSLSLWILGKLRDLIMSIGDSASCGAPQDSFSFDYVSCKRPKDTDPTLASCLELDMFSTWPRSWFQIFFIFTSIWGRLPFWLIFFKWVETTNLAGDFIFSPRSLGFHDPIWLLHIFQMAWWKTSNEFCMFSKMDMFLRVHVKP